MKALLLLALLLLAVQVAAAQETPELADWTTEQRCITAPSQPPEGWTYDGVIFTFKPGDGVHARRADVPTRYYIAFDSESEFGSVGSFSPDGKWFAVPAGHTSHTDTTFLYYPVGDEYRIYSTMPIHTMYRVMLKVTNGVFRPIWLDNERVLIQGYSGDDWSEKGYIFNVTDQSLILADSLSIDLSPDTTLPILPNLQWAADFSHFVAVLTTRDQIGIFDRSGQVLSLIPVETGSVITFTLSNDGGKTAYLAYKELAGALHIADLATRTITNTCVQTWGNVAFSPDGRQLAFGLEPAGYVYVLDLEAWEAYRIDLAAADVIGWYPVD